MKRGFYTGVQVILVMLLLGLTFVSAESEDELYEKTLEGAFDFLSKSNQVEILEDFKKLDLEEQHQILFSALKGASSEDEFTNKLIQSYEGKSFEEFNKLVSYAAKQELENAGAILLDDFKVGLEEEGLKYENGNFVYETKGVKRILKLDDLPASKNSGLPELKQIVYDSQNGFYYKFGDGGKRKEIVCDEGRIDGNGFLKDFLGLKTEERSISFLGFDENFKEDNIIQIGKARAAENVDDWVNGIHVWGKDVVIQIDDKTFRVHSEDSSFENQGYGFIDVVDSSVFHVRGIIETTNLQIEVPSTNEGLVIFDNANLPDKENVEGLVSGDYEYLKINQIEDEIKVAGNMKYAAVYSNDEKLPINLDVQSDNVFIKESDETYFEIIEDEVYVDRKEGVETPEKEISYYEPEIIVITPDEVKEPKKDNVQIISESNDKLEEVLESDDEFIVIGGSGQEEIIKNPMEAATHKYINQARGTVLKWDEDIAEICRQHSQTMHNRGSIGHDGFSNRVSQIGGGGAENVAMFGGSSTEPERSGQTFANMWMNSRGHRNNIMNMGYTRTGIGIVSGPNGVYATQIFAR